eukprot:CAMPEP_0114645058 /NCGR_PEP_ID=MMETSP0191-20121206/4328_1 /TAXON_ID=126664 /ORGANISM="Sorites sp." /LENGTH=93 /DNA_ID=CAMNT_0001857621 /DNA_START=31 /DNA_END=312 /DNA_ORIENTATION=-
MAVAAAGRTTLFLFDDFSTSSVPPEVQAVLPRTALVKRVPEGLVHMSCDHLAGDPEMFIPMHVHHLIGRQVHHDQTGLMESQHEDPWSSNAMY